MVNVTEIRRPTGANAMRTVESRSRSCESRVIIVDSKPSGTLMAV